MASFVAASMGSTIALASKFPMTQFPHGCLRSGDGVIREKRTGLIGVGNITSRNRGKLTEMIEEKVKEAIEVCLGDERSDECKVAWDEVEEVSQAKADLRLKLLQKQDPLESFCQDNPETDECRIYDA
ncbi:hypothetical protein RHSIM_Rhsim07G0258100 [Rhododendron simsii]|uniref:CP12 domain-containing protein n=1 Tax=Rhododendron simsii TaxID=118357 RepID=A0A834LFE4_RHOSS|nr:hypothetical protein RHSIM_Rhsim07G0258100 [Rhododendron simsii]